MVREGKCVDPSADSGDPLLDPLCDALVALAGLQSSSATASAGGAGGGGGGGGSSGGAAGGTQSTTGLGGISQHLTYTSYILKQTPQVC